MAPRAVRGPSLATVFHCTRRLRQLALHCVGLGSTLFRAPRNKGTTHTVGAA